jgi:hypothetical protein
MRGRTLKAGNQVLVSGIRSPHGEQISGEGAVQSL